MLILPLGREDGVLQQQAGVSYSLIALNVVMFVFLCFGTSDRDLYQLNRSWRSTIKFLRERPHLQVPPQVRSLMPADLRDRRPAESQASLWDLAREQGEADLMAADLRRQYEATPSVKYAYIPVVGSWVTILTSMFLHGGILHLVGNMLFLFATAPSVEERFGHVLFLLMYLSGGVVATLSYAARAGDSVIPLVGASGAIAAVMGAYLVCFWRERMRLMFIPIPFIPTWNYRFTMPALLVLPIWFLEQVAAIPAESESGVAVTAHVAGFAYGFVFALLAALAGKGLSRIELAPKKVHQPATAKELRAALDAALARRDVLSIDAYGARLLGVHGAKDRAAASALIQELSEMEHAPRLSQFLLRAAEVAERSGDRAEAIAMLERISPQPIAVLVKLAALRRASGDVFGARAILVRALRHPGCSEEWATKIRAELA